MPTKTVKKIDPKKFFEKLSDKEKNICFTFSHTENGWQKCLAYNPSDKFTVKLDQNPHLKIEQFTEFVTKNTKKKRKLIGYISYDAGYHIHKVKKTAIDDLKLPDICFYAFENWIEFNGEQAKLIYKKNSFLNEFSKINERKIKPKEKKIINKNFQTTITKSQYNTAYKKIENYIKEGDIYQINLTHRLEGESSMPPRDLFLKILENNKVDHSAYIEGQGFQVLSASPERFIKIKNGKIETSPVKGTRPRGKTKKEDENLKKELIKSEKEAAELNMITDLLRNDIGKVSKIGTVKVTGNRLISKCETVWHTYSKVEGILSTQYTPTEALISMLSGGSITGCPKKRAMEIIDEIEPKTRGIYTGVIGTIDPNQNLDFNIAIRTIVKKEKKLYLQVGGGIVVDSTNKSEYEETLHKAKSFMKILK